MSTYAELKAQADELLRRAEEARRAELAEVIQKLKQQIKEHGIQAEDLFPDVRRSGARSAKSKKPPMYRGPNGELWAGGSGRKPEWVRAVLSQGGNIEDYKI